MVADGVPTLLLPYLLVGGDAGDATFLGLATLLAIATAALLQPLAGKLSDRVGRRPVACIGVAAAGAGLAIIVISAGSTVVFVGLLVTLCGVSVAQAGQQALLPDYLDTSRRGVASGLKGAFDVGGALLAFVVLAALLGSGEPTLAAVALFGVLGLSTVAGILLLARTRKVDRTTKTAAATSVSERAQFARIVMARFLFLLGIYAVGRFMFLFVADAWNLSADDAAAQAGLALTVLAALTVAASIPAGWLADRLGRRPVMVAGAGLAAVGIALVPFTRDPVGLIGAGVLLALGSAAFGSASWAALSEAVAPERSGWQLGLANLGTAGAAAAAGLFGVVIDLGNGFRPEAGYVVAFGLAAVAALAGGALAWRWGSLSRARVPPAQFTTQTSATVEAR
ncbi:MAG TPA: MFS transporter [Candidatus Limnocylindrales bacterium]|nr:MFS transporter [Candidatus Limnocylindrales bacterium]